MAMSPENVRSHPIDRDKYQGTTLLDSTMRTLLDFEHTRPPVVLGVVSVMSADRKANNVAILVNAYGLKRNEAAIQPRVDKIFTGVKLATANLPPEVLADELTRPDPVLHRQSWFVDTSVIHFEENVDGVKTAVFVCVSPDADEARRMEEVIRQQKTEVESGKKSKFNLARLAR